MDAQLPFVDRPVRRRMGDDDRRYECTMCRHRLMHPDDTVMMYREKPGDTPHMLKSMYRSNLVDTIVNGVPPPDVSQHLTKAEMSSPEWQPYFYDWNACLYVCEECLQTIPEGDRLWLDKRFKVVSKITWFPEANARDALRKKWNHNRRFAREYTLEGAYVKLDAANHQNMSRLSNWNPVLSSNLCVLWCCANEQCLKAPVLQGGWFLKITPGGKFKWLCAFCGTLWGAASGMCRRALVFACDDPENPGRTKYRCFHIGEVSDLVESQLSALRCIILHNKFSKNDAGSVLDSLLELHRDLECMLLDLPEREVGYSVWPYIAADERIVCVNPQLMLRSEGVRTEYVQMPIDANPVKEASLVSALIMCAGKLVAVHGDNLVTPAKGENVNFGNATRKAWTSLLASSL